PVPRQPALQEAPSRPRGNSTGFMAAVRRVGSSSPPPSLTAGAPVVSAFPQALECDTRCPSMTLVGSTGPAGPSLPASPGLLPPTPSTGMTASRMEEPVQTPRSTGPRGGGDDGADGTVLKPSLAPVGQDECQNAPYGV